MTVVFPDFRGKLLVTAAMATPIFSSLVAIFLCLRVIKKSMETAKGSKTYTLKSICALYKISILIYSNKCVQ